MLECYYQWLVTLNHTYQGLIVVTKEVFLCMVGKTCYNYNCYTILCTHTVVDPESQRQETVSLCKEVLKVLNNCNPHGRTTGVVHTTLLQWIQSSPNSLLLMPLITAACRTLASLPNMVQVIEECIDAHFSSNPGMYSLPFYGSAPQ